MEAKEQGFSLPDGAALTGKVLVAEDDPLVRKVAAETLKLYDFEIIMAENGTQALELFERHNGSIDLLIIDMVMPGKTGRRVADTILAERPDLPVIFISGYSPENLKELGVDATGVEFLWKPFSPKEMLEKVYSLLFNKEFPA